MLLRSELKDRILRFDGTSVLSNSGIAEAIVRGVPLNKVRTLDAHSEDVKTLNSLVPLSDQVLTDDDEVIIPEKDWQIPENIKALNFEEHVLSAFERRLPELLYSDVELQAAIDRLEQELLEIETRQMTMFFRTIVHVLESFREQNVIWGVGRGSSCASYVLFILGLHAVDAVRLDIPMSEFFHE